MNRAGRALLTAAVAVPFVLPLVFLVSGSVRARGLPPPAGLELVPPQSSVDAYADVFDVLPMATYLRNSLVVVAVAVPLTVLIASLAGFGVRLLAGRAKGWAVALTVAALLVPASAVWASRFEVFRRLGTIDTFVPLVAPALLATSPFLVLVYAWAFHRRVDDEQLESSRLDGAGALRQWWSIGLPQVHAATLAVAVLAFTFHWGNFFDPLLYTRSQSVTTLPLGLRLLQQLNPTDFPLLLAGAVLVATVPIVVFLAAQRWFLDPAEWRAR